MLNIFNKTFGRTYGYGFDARRIMIQGIVNSLLYYGAAITYPRLNLKYVTKQIQQLHRACCLKAIYAYSTVSGAAAAVLAGLPPLDLAIAKVETRRLADIGETARIEPMPEVKATHTETNRQKNKYKLRNRIISRKKLDDALDSEVDNLWQQR